MIPRPFRPSFPPGFFGILAGVALVAGCSTLGAWLDEPATGAARGDGTVTVSDPSSGVSVTAPTAATEPVKIPVGEEGGSVTYTPPPPSTEPTRGDVIAETGGGIVGLLLGNPMLGVLASAALKGGFSIASGRRKGARVATA